MRLVNNVTNVNWSKFVANDRKTLNDVISSEIVDDEFDGFTFADEATIEYQDLIRKQLADAKAGVTNAIVNEEEQIDVDDI
jgi:hypothetical protein